MNEGMDNVDIKEGSSSGEIHYVKHIDLRGTMCPMNIIIAKKEIAKLSPGVIVRITVDFPAAKDDVPKSLQKDGHEILKVEDKGSFADIFIKV